MTTDDPHPGNRGKNRPVEWIDEEIAEIREHHLLRSTVARSGAGGKFVSDGVEILNFSSNDYLDLSRDPRLQAAAINATQEHGTGATASRLVTGTLACHDALEQRLAAHKGYPACLLFGSGYLANIGTIPALVGRDDHAFADRLVHASMIDGIRLSGARLHRFQHNDMDHLAQLLKQSPEQGRKLILTEALFSMDGDLAPLTELVEVAERHGAMVLVDEAHSGGVFGPAGAGRIAELNLQDRVHVSMGTLSKALGGYGGFVACAAPLRELLVNRARSFIYTTGLPPGVTSAGVAALEILDRESALGAKLLERSDAFRRDLHGRGIDTATSQSQIIPVIVGDSDTALRAAEALSDNHLLAVAMRPPTVPRGTARLRLSVTLAHEASDLERAADLIANSLAAREAPVNP